MVSPFMLWLRRCSPIVVIATVLFVLVLMRSPHALAVDLNLDQGFDEAGNEIKRYMRKGMNIFAIVVCGIGVGYSAYKFVKKDHEAMWYLVGTAAAAALFIAAGSIFG